MYRGRLSPIMACTGEDYLQLWDVQGKIIFNYGMYRGRLSPIMGCTGEDYPSNVVWPASF